MEERVTELENRYTHLERIVQELLDTVYRQQQHRIGSNATSNN